MPAFRHRKEVREMPKTNDIDELEFHNLYWGYRSKRLLELNFLMKSEAYNFESKSFRRVILYRSTGKIIK